MLTATIVSGTTTGDAIEMAVKALTDGTQPPARTLIELKSYPTLERLQVVGALKHQV